MEIRDELTIYELDLVSGGEYATGQVGGITYYSGTDGSSIRWKDSSGTGYWELTAGQKGIRFISP